MFNDLFENSSESLPYIISFVFSLFVLFLSMVPLAIARYHKGFHWKYLRAPKLYTSKTYDWGRRAMWAHENSFESFVIYAPSICFSILLINNGVSLSSESADLIIIYPIFRIYYLFSYINDYPLQRIISWGGALFVNLYLYLDCFSRLL